jgi:phosphoribosylformylglycinamidine cyclo-ligase
VFQWLAAEGEIAPTEMLRTFNCGIGMIVIAAPAEAAAVTQVFVAAGEQAVSIGKVVHSGEGPRVVYDGQLDLG